MLLTSYVKMGENKFMISCEDAEILAKELEYAAREAKEHKLIHTSTIFDLNISKKVLLEILVSPHAPHKGWLHKNSYKTNDNIDTVKISKLGKFIQKITGRKKGRQ